MKEAEGLAGHITAMANTGGGNIYRYEKEK